MGIQYSHLSTEQRNLLQSGLNEGLKPAEIARCLGCHRSTVGREIRRGLLSHSYDAVQGGEVARRRRRRGRRKLVAGSALLTVVLFGLLNKWSPEQIAKRLKRCCPDDKGLRVSHETIYAYIYAQPKGELRRTLIAALRRGNKKRMPRSRGTDRRGRLKNMVSIHERPEEVQGREVPGHWEGDLIKGAGNKSAIGTLVERKSRYVLLAKLEGEDANATLAGFSRRLRTLPASVRKTMTYDQGKEMALHEELSKILRIDIFFADPHSPWQRPSNENTNGLLRQYLPKGMDLSGVSQRKLSQIAESLNNRPRKCLNFLTPNEVMGQQIKELTTGVALQT
jgi:IS30 family transposase